VNGAASAIDAMAKRLRVNAPYQRLSEWLNTAEKPPLFINAVSGIGSPFWRSDVTSTFVGRGSSAEKLVAVAESVLFLIQVNIEAMDRIAGKAREIVVSGGLAKLDALSQRLANLSGYPVRCPMQHEATARGAAFLLAGQPRTWRETENTCLIPELDAALNERYRRWREELARRLRG